MVDRQQFDRCHAEIAQVLDGRRVREPEIGSSQFWRHLWKETAEPFDVRLVDSGLPPGNTWRCIIFPVERGIDDDAARHKGSIIAWASVRVAGVWSRPGIITKDRTGVVEVTVDGTCVGIDEELGWIETQTDFGTVGSVDTIA